MSVSIIEHTDQDNKCCHYFGRIWWKQIWPYYLGIRNETKWILDIICLSQLPTHRKKKYVRFENTPNVFLCEKRVDVYFI